MKSPRKMYAPLLLLPVYLLAAGSIAANEWVMIPAGEFLMGSTPAQVETGYRISAQGYGHDRVRQLGWFDHEAPQHTVTLSQYLIQKTAVTQREYAQFVDATHYPAPFVDAATWRGYGLVHPYQHVQHYNWRQGRPPEHRGDHPVVLVSSRDAEAYARWLSHKLHRTLRLPTAAEWEKAMRGTDGRLFPWGNRYDATRLNNDDHDPFGTMPVGKFTRGASPYGVLDGAGQVYEWTSTSQGENRRVVKGGSWDDHGGICRSAAFHDRPMMIKHIIIGFRLVDDTR
ncbi:MAG: SUMF1/EgtB/PvdO family nonheme iron enzyme [Mariprofundales bacterium]